MNNESYYTVEIASDPNTSPDILRKILEEGNRDIVSWDAAMNPNCPPETLKEILERGKDDLVSSIAAYNSNCPPLDKIKWMKATGQIGVENPNDPKQFIEYEEVKEDTDLQKLRDLMLDTH